MAAGDRMFNQRDDDILRSYIINIAYVSGSSYLIAMLLNTFSHSLCRRRYGECFAIRPADPHVCSIHKAPPSSSSSRCIITFYGSLHSLIRPNYHLANSKCRSESKQLGKQSFMRGAPGHLARASDDPNLQLPSIQTLQPPGRETPREN